MTFFHNHVSLAGNLTRDPELRTAGASQVAKFGLAINRRWRDREGQQQDEVTFVDCETWGRTAEIVSQYLQKGRPVFVEGRLKLDTWESPDGSRQSRLRVIASSVQFLPENGRGGSGSGSGDRTQRPQAVAEAVTGTLPGEDGDDPPF